MQNPKPFMTYEQQINKLIDEKNLVINDKLYAEKILKQIGYFTLISGYKDLLRNPTTKKYIDNTTFEEIVALYRFDESLRELFLKYILVFEQKMKSLISYSFTERHGENQAHYLSNANYVADVKYVSDVQKLISILRNITVSSTDYHYITHQRVRYGNVPLWVLVKVLTFGNISSMYKLLPGNLQTKISKEYDNVTERELAQYLKVLTKFRNVCAHNERLYSYRTKDDIPDTALHSKLEIPKKGTQYIYGKRDLFCVVIALRYLLDANDFKAFKNRLVRIINSYTANTVHIKESELLNHMGFPQNWKKITTTF